jgi:MFS family permease
MNEQAAAISTAAVPKPADSHSWPSPAKAWYGVGVFTVTLLVLFTNSGVINLLAQPIKRDLQLTDVETSLIIGFAAAFFNALFMLPVSRLVDIISRRLIIGFGLLMASVASFFSGLSGTFLQLFMARLVGGIGGSGNGPATFSILADYFPAAKLPKALAVLNIGFIYAIAASTLLGGTLIAAVSAMSSLSLPLIGEVRPWQAVFLVMAVPDLLLALLMFTTVHEPKRRGVRAMAAEGMAVVPRPKVVPVRDVFKFLYDNRRAFGPMFAGLALNSLALGGAGAWTAPFFERTYGWGPAQYGIIQGFVLLLIAPIGLIAGGMLAERLAKRGYDDANMRVVFIASLLHLPFAMLYALMPNPHLAIALSAANIATISIGTGPQNAALQVIVPNEMRGQITALFLFCFTMIGLGIAPTLVAALTQYVFGEESMLRYSIASIHILLGPLATIIFWYGLKAYGQAFARARAWH